MRILIESVLFLVAGGGIVGIGMQMLNRRRSPKSIAPNMCKHRHWSKWKTLIEKPIYLYGEPDSGKELPDRVDAQMARECLSCGIKQVKTVRGIDSQQYK